MSNTWNKILANQLKKPSGILGHLVSSSMEKRNSSTYKWMISNMDFSNAKNILEIGYGTGEVLNYIARNYHEINLYGIDFSKVMRGKALNKNRKYVDKGKMILDYGNLLEYNSPVKHDIILAINVIYFWEDLDTYFKKIFSLMGTNGKLYLYMSDASVIANLPIGNTGVFNKHLIESVTKSLNECGFSNTKYVPGQTHHSKCYCVSAKKL